VLLCRQSHNTRITSAPLFPRRTQQLHPEPSDCSGVLLAGLSCTPAHTPTPVSACVAVQAAMDQWGRPSLTLLLDTAKAALGDAQDLATAAEELMEVAHTPGGWVGGWVGSWWSLWCLGGACRGEGVGVCRGGLSGAGEGSGLLSTMFAV
jgi:hypothetical protein